MTTFRLFTILLLHFIFNILPATSAPPPELTVLRQQYEKVFAERVMAVHEAAIAELDAKFKIALENALARAQRAGDLPTALAIQTDQKLLATGSPIPDDDPITPESLRNIRAIYREQLSKLIEQRNANGVTLQEPYISKLKGLETTLTKTGRLEEAKEVSDYRVSLSAEAPRRMKSSIPYKLVFKAMVDATDDIIIQDGKLRIHHIDWSKPQEIKVNEKKWLPIWTGNDTEAYDAFDRPLPSLVDAHPRIRLVKGEGEAAIRELPSKENGYQLVIRVTDAILGASEFELHVLW